MPAFSPPRRPGWFDALLADVDRAFEVTGTETPGWDDPHPDRDPTDEEYSRVLDPGKYRILDARVEAWVQVLDASGLTRADDVEAGRWLDAPRQRDDLDRVRSLRPACPDGLTLLLATTLVGGAPFGLDVGVAKDDIGAAFLDTVPDCGCDACDSGSADLLATLDGWVLTVARGGVVHVRSETTRISQTIDGWKSSGPDRQLSNWLDESVPVPDGVLRWMGAAWQ